ncbi:MAG: PmoA family protein [Planctomycetota bacterium]
MLPKPKHTAGVVLLFALVMSLTGKVSVTASEIDLADDGDKIVVTIDGQPFTNYHYRGFAKPILYPVFGPGQRPMTRSYPIVKGVDNEATDHPHHKSIWYTHDEVGGVRFWVESSPDKPIKNIGTQKTTSTKIEGDSIIATTDWTSSDGEVVCSDRRMMTFAADEKTRTIDYKVTWIASSGEVIIGDTKEGTMGIRTHPMLRLTTKPKIGNHTADGQAINSEGLRDRDLWGKRAAWVDYWGTIDGQVTGIAIFDHPLNYRHPTWWHARDYGLIAANPFGINHFEGKPDGTGDLIIKADETITFRYRFVFHRGDAAEADIQSLYDEFAETPSD